MLCRVLLVDDDPAVLNALRRELLRKPDLGDDGIEIESFTSAETALQRVAEADGYFDAAIVDYRMKGMNGITLLQQLRKVQPDMVRILLTGLLDMNGAIAAINTAQVDQVVSKPWQEYDLKARTALALKQRTLFKKAAGSSRQPRNPLSQPYRIFLVDDEPAQLNALEREVSMQGKATNSARAFFEITQCSEPELALMMAAKKCPDLVISDYKMPGMDGIRLLNRIHMECPCCVSILMSGHADAKVLVDAINQAGVYYFVGKPWAPIQLRGVIAEALKHRDLIEAAN